MAQEVVKDPELLKELNAAFSAKQDAVKNTEENTVTNRALVSELTGQRPQRGALEALGRGAGMAGRYTLQGLAAIPALPGDLGGLAYNYFTGSDIPLPSADFSNKLTKLGFPTPETSSERITGDMVSGAVSGGPLGLAGAIAGGASGFAGGATREAGGGALAQLGASLIAGGGGLVAANRLGNLTRARANVIADRTATAPITPGQPGPVPNPIDVGAKSFDKVVERMRADFPDDKKFLSALSEYARKEGVSLAEMGKNRTVNLAKGSAQYPSGEAIAEPFIQGKVADASERIKKSISDYISPNTDYYGTLDNIVTEGRKAASPLYKDAFSGNQSIASPVIDKILDTPIGKKSLGQAVENMRNEMAKVAVPDKELTETMRDLVALGEMKAVPGGLAAGLKLKTLDYVKRGMDDAYRLALRAGDEPEMRRIQELRSEFVKQLDSLDITAQNGKPGLYAQARKTSGDYLSNRDAMEAGTNFQKLDANLLKRQIKDYGPAELESFKVGVSKAIRQQIDDAPDGANLYKRVFGSPSKRAKIKNTLGEKEFLRLSADLRAEENLYKLRDSVLGGSPTASKQIAAQDFASKLGEDGIDTMNQIANRGIVSVGIDKGIVMIQKMFDGISDKTAGEVAKILYETDPKKKLEIAKKIAQRTGIRSKQNNDTLKYYFQLTDNLKSRKNAVLGSARGTVAEMQSDNPINIKGE